jgi:putative intracellular protease/amidase
MAKRILIVLTSHDDLGGKEPTGFYVSEAAHPWKVFTEAGYQVDVASVAGGAPPQDSFDPKDPIQAEFVEQVDLTHTPSVAELDGTAYDAVFYAGGHGTMWDFPDDPDVGRLGRQVYEHDGVVAAVCHGPAALVNLTLSDGTRLLEGKNVAGFTNDEETARGVADVVPFLLEDELVKRGANHSGGPKWRAHVVADGRLITGQNPASATGTAEAVVSTLEQS